MIKAIIVDDQDANIDLLRSLLNRFFPQLDIVATSNDPAEAIPLAERLQPDLLFLDIDMPGMTGFDLLKRLENRLRVEVIFVTAFVEFALEAYRSHAAGYITKPICTEDLIGTVNRVLEQIAQKKVVAVLGNRSTDQKLALSTQKGVRFIDVQTIQYCESEGNYTTFFLSGNEQVIVSKQIGRFEQQLSDQQFIRIHDRYIINLKYLKAYNRGNGGSVVLESNKELPVSVRRKEQLLKWFE